MISLRSIQIYLLVFTASFVNADSFDVYKLTDADVLAAKEQLQSEEFNNKIAKVATVTAGLSLAGLLWYKALPVIGDFMASVDERGKVNALLDVVRNDPDSTQSDVGELSKKFGFKNDAAMRQLISATAVMVEKNQAEHADKSWFSLSSWATWTKDQVWALPGVTMMVVMPMMGEGVINKVKDVFGKRNIWWLTTRRLEIPEHFQKVKVSQVHWDPDKFVDGSDSQEEIKLRKYARKVSKNYSNTDAEQLDEIKKASREVFVEECNEMMQQMGYVIAYMKHLVEDNKNQTLLNGFADQLFLSTYEFGCKLEELLEDDKVDEIFSELSLFQSTFSVTINNFLIFTK